MNKLFTRLISKSLNKLSKTDKLASTYKAAVITEIGKPLEIQEKKVPKLKPNQVRVQVVYCSVNSVDCHKFRNDSDQLPFIPGYELSGEILEKGTEVKDEVIRIGERVVGLNLLHFGGFAEQCVLDINDVWRIPGDLERKDAAVIAYGHSTALYTFSKLSTIKEKEKVIISAGPAGMGLAAVDIAANVYKAQVIGLVDTEERGELVRQRGAFETVSFSEKLPKTCMAVTENKGANVVYEAVGEQMELIGKCVAVGGKLFHAAPFFYKTIPAPKPHTFASIVSLKELKKQNNNLYRSIVNDTLEMANDGLISAHISAKFNLTQVNEAIKFIDDKKCTGKVLIYIDN
ncbi:quinone oxidoreductase-like protein 2 homolog [Diorhabda carinulata]|uniref:quinone oxidoreductase-like protein 2 homolog n=1 Tax=Diorhabda carinulata TaxID=1163345 RepID=UPI0025A197EA|nr:quinone oxidoreductase-like protein 2 homolog [Diorhabda carinulata]XP_057652644.1 quinone oxidoreductase-like protein 2 homolog [Diorhabda carinulata]